MAIVSERRRIVVVNGERQTAVAVPAGSRLGEALTGLGITIEPGRHVLLDHGGREIRIDSAASELHDGALLAVVDLHHGPDQRATAAATTEPQRNHAGVWWMLGAVGVIASVVALLYAGSDGVLSDGVLSSSAERFVACAVLAIGALASAAVWAMRAPRDALSEALTMLAPLSLAFAAGLVVIDRSLVEGTHLAVVSGLLFSGVLATLLSAMVTSVRLRGAAGTAAVIVLLLAVIWGLTLLTGWGAVAAATLSAGAVPLGMRFLPSTLVNLPEGHHIDYKHFMSARWSVRGDIPHTPESVEMDAVREVVDGSSARLVAGMMLLSVIAAGFLPFALVSPAADNPFVGGGVIGLTCTLAIALLLSARHYTSRVLRWAPRAAALIVVLTAAIAASSALGQLAVVATAAALFLAGVGAAIALVPIGRGARSLVWSRLADVFEWLAVVLSFPCALLAADALTLLRGMMAS